MSGHLNLPAIGFFQLVLCSKLQHLWISQTYICRVAPQPRAGISFQGQRHYSRIFIQMINYQVALQPRPRISFKSDQYQFKGTSKVHYDGLYYSHTVPSRCRHTTRHLGATSYDVFLFKGEVHISPESLQANDLALGAYTTQIKLSKVPSRCRHVNRHLGATVFSCLSRL